MSNSTAPASGHPAHPARTRPPDPLVAHDLRGWCGRVLGATRLAAGRLTAIFALMAAAQVGTGWLVSRPFVGAPGEAVHYGTGPVLAALVGFPAAAGLMAAMAQAAAVFTLIRSAAGQPVPVAQALRFGAGRGLLLYAWWTLGALAVAVGTLLFVGPGLYLAIVLLGTLTCVVVVERGHAGRCWTLLTGRFFATLGRLALFWMVAALWVVLVKVVASALAGGSGPASLHTAVTVYVAWAVPLGVLGTAVLAVTYAELRARHDAAVTSATLAAELTGPRISYPVRPVAPGAPVDHRPVAGEPEPEGPVYHVRFEWNTGSVIAVVGLSMMLAMLLSGVGLVGALGMSEAVPLARVRLVLMIGGCLFIAVGLVALVRTVRRRRSKFLMDARGITWLEKCFVPWRDIQEIAVFTERASVNDFLCLVRKPGAPELTGVARTQYRMAWAYRALAGLDGIVITADRPLDRARVAGAVAAFAPDVPIVDRGELDLSVLGATWRRP